MNDVLTLCTGWDSKDRRGKRPNSVTESNEGRRPSITMGNSLQVLGTLLSSVDTI